MTKRLNFFEENPEARSVYEKLREELAAGFTRQLKASEAGRLAADVGRNLTEIQPDQPDRMAQIILNGYSSGLIRFRDPQEQTHLPAGLSQDLRDLSQSLVVIARRASRVWSKLPPGPSRALASLGQWSQETVKLAKVLSEQDWLPENAGKWKVVDEIIWGFLKSLKQITGHYHYAEVAELAMFCLDDRYDRHNIASLKMVVHRRKRRETKFRQALEKLEEKQEVLISKPIRPGSSRRKRPRKR